MTRALHDVAAASLWATSVLIVVWVIQYSLLADWWHNAIGVTIVGETLCLLGIYVPSLIALAAPSEGARIGRSDWYLWLITGIVAATAIFTGTRIVTWELIRRRRGSAPVLPADTLKRIAELEAEVAALKGGP